MDWNTHWSKQHLVFAASMVGYAFKAAFFVARRLHRTHVTNEAFQDVLECPWSHSWNVWWPKLPIASASFPCPCLSVIGLSSFELHRLLQSHGEGTDQRTLQTKEVPASKCLLGENVKASQDITAAKLLRYFTPMWTTSHFLSLKGVVIKKTWLRYVNPRCLEENMASH